MEDVKSNRTSYIKYTGLIFLVLFVLSFFILFLLETEIRRSKTDEFKANEMRIVEMEKEFLDRDFSTLVGDLHYLHHAFKDNLVDGINIDEITNQWVHFSYEKKMYDQIRYIDVDGKEVIRVNYDEGGSYKVSQDMLQNKADRYYFKESMKLSQGDIYISPLDLNIENDKIELPYKAVTRMSIAVKDNNDVMRGTIIVNYLAKHTLDSFRAYGENSQGEILLVNNNGYSISSLDASNDWNFMFDERKGESFSQQYSSVWDDILLGKKQIITSDGFFTIQMSDFSKTLSEIHLDGKVNSSENWYVISFLERNETNAHLFHDDTMKIIQDVLKKNTLYFLLLTAVSAVVGLMIFINRLAYTKIKFHSEYDSLTKTFNRRAGMDKLNHRIESKDRRFSVISLCYIDINGLKKVNDNLGHKYGDELIVTVVNTIKSTIREEDFLVRLGGDEFLVVFSSIDIDESENVWQRIVNEFTTINNNEQRPYMISVSHGVVDYSLNNTNQIENLLSEADKKMYEEKKIIKKDLDVIKKSKRL